MSPNELFPGFSFDGTSIYIPINTLKGLRTEDVHPFYGDYRELFFRLCSTLQTKYTQLPTSKRPASLSVLTPLVQSASARQGVSSDAVFKAYMFAISKQLLYEDPFVVDEP